MSGDITQVPLNEILHRILSRLDSVDGHLTGLDTRLQMLEARSYETKPIWERTLAELVEVNRRLDSLDRRFSVLNDDVLHTRADHRKLEERIGSL